VVCVLSCVPRGDCGDSCPEHAAPLVYAPGVCVCVCMWMVVTGPLVLMRVESRPSKQRWRPHRQQHCNGGNCFSQGRNGLRVSQSGVVETLLLSRRAVPGRTCVTELGFPGCTVFGRCRQ
jgi:hypothetical protein